MTAGWIKSWSLYLCQAEGPWQFSQPTFLRCGVFVTSINPVGWLNPTARETRPKLAIAPVEEYAEAWAVKEYLLCCL